VNALNRIFRSMRTSMTSDSGFETYYGSLVRQTPEGGPSASEARRDFRAVRESIGRVIIF
jgi:hypothetical protein